MIKIENCFVRRLVLCNKELAVLFQSSAQIFTKDIVEGLEFLEDALCKFDQNSLSYTEQITFLSNQYPTIETNKPLQSHEMKVFFRLMRSLLFVKSNCKPIYLATCEARAQ